LHEKFVVPEIKRQFLQDDPTITVNKLQHNSTPCQVEDIYPSWKELLDSSDNNFKHVF
jgi:hypothetical protein